MSWISYFEVTEPGWYVVSDGNYRYNAPLEVVLVEPPSFKGNDLVVLTDNPVEWEYITLADFVNRDVNKKFFRLPDID